jgi:hypothetical protein
MLTFEAVIYLLCIFTSGLCSWLLIAAFRRHRQSLLLSSAVSFSFLTLNNFLVFTDLIMLPQIDLSLARSLTALLAGLILLGDMIWGMR